MRGGGQGRGSLGSNTSVDITNLEPLSSSKDLSEDVRNVE